MQKQFAIEPERHRMQFISANDIDSLSGFLEHKIFSQSAFGDLQGVDCRTNAVAIQPSMNKPILVFNMRSRQFICVFAELKINKNKIYKNYSQQSASERSSAPRLDGIMISRKKNTHLPIDRI